MGLKQLGCVRVVIVDDQAVFRDAARQCLSQRGYDVVAEAGCATSAMDAVERYQPDAMLLDVQLGGDDGFAVCDALTRLYPELAVVLTSAENYDHIPEQLEPCGARGFVPKAHLPRVNFGHFWQPA